MCYSWKYERKETIPRAQRFPPVDGLRCSQCARPFKDLEFGGAFLNAPLCRDCSDCLVEVERVLKGTTEKSVKPPFTKEEAQSIFGQAGDRAKAWAEENPEYMRAVDLLKPRIWAENIYDLNTEAQKKE